MDYILGVAVSLVVEAIKRKGGLSSIGSMITLLVISILGGGAYVYLQSTGSWQTIVQVLVAASAFHNLVLKRFDK